MEMGWKISFIYIYNINNHYTCPPHASYSPLFDRNVNVPDMAVLSASYADDGILEWILSHY